MKAVPELIDDLKESLRKIAPTAIFDPQPETSPTSDGEVSGGLATGFAELDQTLSAGGLAVGRLTEIAGAPSSGKTALTLGIIARLEGLVAYVDGRDQLYPPAAAALGVDLERMLVVKPPVVDISRATEILIRSRGFDLIAVDLPAQHRLARSIAHRLRTAAHQTRTTLVVLCNRPGDVDAAHTRMQVCASGGLAKPATTISINKGSRSGDIASTEIAIASFRAAGKNGAPIAPILERTAPGVDPNPDAPTIDLGSIPLAEGVAL